MAYVTPAVITRCGREAMPPTSGLITTDRQDREAAQERDTSANNARE
jgi:hypothetical protein